MRRKQIGPINVNGGVHTAHKQHQRKNVPICMRIASGVLCGLGQRNEKPQASATACKETQKQIELKMRGPIWALILQQTIEIRNPGPKNLPPPQASDTGAVLQTEKQNAVSGE